VILGKSFDEIAEFSVGQCELILRAHERERAREKLLDLRALRAAIAAAFSKEGISEVKTFANELLRVINAETSAVAAGVSPADLRANRRAAAAAAREFGAA